jgi:hypothetical protein
MRQDGVIEQHSVREPGRRGLSEKEKEESALLSAL